MVDTKVTLTDGDVEIFYQGDPVPFVVITRGWLDVTEVSELTALLNFGGGKNSASGWQRWVYPTGLPELEPVLAIARFIVGRNETGVGPEPDLPFHRTGDALEDFVTYPTVNSELKDDGEL